MALSDFHRRRLAIVRPLIRAFARLLGISAGKPLSAQQFTDLVQVLTDTANAGREQMSALAFEHYQSVRPEGSEAIGAPTLNPLPTKYFEKVVQSHRDSLESEDHAQAGVTRITQAAVRSVENSARETTQAATRYDPVARGWARVLTGAESCGWCAMLASRGPVYESKKGATKTSTRTYRGQQYDEWHLGCDCIAVPVFRGHEKDWEGYAEYKKLEKLWGSTTKDASGKGKLRAFDRAFAKEDSKAYSPLTS